MYQSVRLLVRGPPATGWYHQNRPSAVDFGCWRSIEGEIDRRRSVEGEKGKKKKKRKRRKKKRRRRIPRAVLACTPSPPAGRPRAKLSHRERQSSSRHHRGNHSRDRHDHRDREGSWISSKHHAPNGAERPRAQLDQHAAAKNYEDTQWDSYRHVPASYYMVQNSSFGSSNSSHGRGTVVGTYTQSALGSDAGGPTRPAIPPILMVYPYDQGVSDVSSVEPLEFGSLGSVHHPEDHVAHHPSDGVPVSGTFEQRHGTYRVGSWRSSPDQPSSPQLKR
ncbi:hypothetical protein GW17_00058125 [Ensete ventricosum]|nr:hypothetical protein GW17_00058125 [Ensete ventricosum]